MDGLISFMELISLILFVNKIQGYNQNMTFAIQCHDLSELMYKCGIT